jgi:HrpA-like RNA helicase
VTSSLLVAVADYHSPHPHRYGGGGGDVFSGASDTFAKGRHHGHSNAGHHKHHQTANRSSAQNFIGGGGGRRFQRRVQNYEREQQRGHGHSTEEAGNESSDKAHREGTTNVQLFYPSASPSIGGEELVGASPLSFRMIDADCVSSAAVDEVSAYLRRHGQNFAEPSVVPAPHLATLDGGPRRARNNHYGPASNRKLAVMVVELSNGQRVQATGSASRRDTAVKLCFMHAQELIDHFSTLSVDSGTAEEDEDGGSSRAPPQPLALREVPVSAQTSPPQLPTDTHHQHTATSGTTHHQHHHRPDVAAWAAYIERVEAYLKNREQVKSRAYSNHSIPVDLGTHPVHDMAAEGMRHWRGLDPLSVTRLHNKYQTDRNHHGGPPGTTMPEMTFVRSFGVTLATFPLSRGGSEPPLFALGVGRNNKDARVRCAMHALEIIRITDTMLQESQSVTRDGGEGGGPHVLMDSISTLALSQQRLLEGYLLLSQTPVHSTFRKEQHGGTKGAIVYTCTFQIGELRCEGRGINRTEAERAAALVALDELESLDPQFKKISDLVNYNPNFQPTALQKLALTPEVHSEAMSCIQQVHHVLNDSCDMELGSLHEFTTDCITKAVGDVEMTVLATTNHTNNNNSSSSTAFAPAATLSSSVQKPSTTSQTKHTKQKKKKNVIGDVDAQHVLDRFSKNRQHYLRTPLCASDPSAAAAAGGAGGAAAAMSVESHRMQVELARLRSDPRYLRQFHTRRTTLAMSKVQGELLDKMKRHQVVVVCGTTGCGKTTQVPQYILDEEIAQGRGDACSIVISQPRRLSAFSIAERIAAERLQPVGQDIGYSIRLDSKPGAHVTLCTTGILLQMFVTQPNLPHISHLIIDEIHERDINGDVALALAKELLVKNPRLKLILMSATLDSDKFSSYFDGAPIVSVDGQTFPVEELYLEDVAEVANKKGFTSPRFDEVSSNGGSSQSSTKRRASHRMIGGMIIPPKIDYNLVAFCVDESIRGFDEASRRTKSVLVFLPGWKELLAAKHALEMLRQDCYIILLHSSVDAAKQKECFQPAPAGTVKVVLATNIAESGITIDDAAVVIDTGLIKLTSDSVLQSNGGGGQQQSNSDESATMTKQLNLIYGSRANCTQRRGRAGRTQGGVCIRLFNRDVWDAMPAFLQPEILRTPLEQVVLRLLSLGYHDPQRMLSTFVDPPNRDSVRRAIDTLRSLDAIETTTTTSEAKDTPHLTLSTLGLYLSLLPCEPRIGKMIIVGALLQCLDTVLTLASSNDVQPFVMRREIAAEVRKKRFAFAHRTQSDHIALVNAYNCFVANDGTKAYAMQHHLNWNNLTLISKYKEQFAQILCNAGLVSRSALMLEKSKQQQYGGSSKQGTTWYVDRSHHSAHWNDLPLVKACLAACLYPNVALLDVGRADDSGRGGGDKRNRRGLNKKKLTMQVRNGFSLSPSKESACRSPDKKSRDEAVDQHVIAAAASPKSGGLDSLHPAEGQKNRGGGGDSDDGQWELDASFQFLYQGIFKIQESNQTFLTTVTPISPWALLLFAAPAEHVRYDSELSLCCINDWLFLSMTKETLEVLLVTKKLFITAMLRKYQHPMDKDNNRCIEMLRNVCSQILASPVCLLAGAQRSVPLSHTKGEIIAPWSSRDDISAAEQRMMADDDGAYDGED